MRLTQCRHFDRATLDTCLKDEARSRHTSPGAPSSRLDTVSRSKDCLFFSTNSLGPLALFWKFVSQDHWCRLCGTTSESEVIVSIRLVSNLMPYQHPRNIPFRLLRTVPWFSQEFSVWDRDLNHSIVRCRLQRHGCRMTQSVGDKWLCRLMSRSVVARRRSLLAAM